MNIILIFACLWALASAVVAMLPMRYQYVPGFALLLMAPVLIVLIGLQYGWGFSVLGAAAFVSMFRNPLRYFYQRFRDRHPEVPK